MERLPDIVYRFDHVTTCQVRIDLFDPPQEGERERQSQLGNRLGIDTCN